LLRVCQAINIAMTTVFRYRSHFEGMRKSGAPHLKLATSHHAPRTLSDRLKMATVAGKTVVMAMLIAWQTLNKQANLQDVRFF